MSVRIIDSNPHGELSSETLDAFVARAQIQLPSEYREFLLLYNGGRPIPSFFWIRPQEDGSTMQQFFGLHEGPQHLCIETYVGEERYGIPQSMVPIGDDGTGNFICMGVGQYNLGEIFFLDHDAHPYQTPDSMEGITRLAGSLGEFLDNLATSPDS